MRFLTGTEGPVLGFLSLVQIFGRTPLGGRSAHRKDLYLHTTQKDENMHPCLKGESNHDHTDQDIKTCPSDDVATGTLATIQCNKCFRNFTYLTLKIRDGNHTNTVSPRKLLDQGGQPCCQSPQVANWP
jgi:hypothetical protein